jgi:hypothetical protein
MHGAAQGTPARAKADNIILHQLIGPALWRLKGLIDDRDTPGAVLMAAIREVLDRTGYREYHEMTFDQIRPHMDRLIAEAEADMTPEELAAHLAKHGKSIA